MIYGPTIADYYYRSGDYAKSVEYADKMIAKNRNYSPAYEQKVMALLAQGDADGAEKVCDLLDTAENAAGVASGDYTSYSLRANLYWYTGKYDAAIKICEEGIEHPAAIPISTATRLSPICSRATTQRLTSAERTHISSP